MCDGGAIDMQLSICQEGARYKPDRERKLLCEGNKKIPLAGNLKNNNNLFLLCSPFFAIRMNASDWQQTTFPSSTERKKNISGEKKKSCQ